MRRPRQPKPVQERFWPKVNKLGLSHPTLSTRCWEWTGAKTRVSSSGLHYGQFKYQGKSQLAHRVSWELANGTIPDGLCVLHRCDNPPCVNPEHLFLGTQLDNVADRYVKGRSARGEKNTGGLYLHLHPELRRGERNGKAFLTESQVREMLARWGQSDVTYNSLAAEYGVAHSHAWAIINRKIWRHIQLIAPDTQLATPTAELEREKADVYAAAICELVDCGVLAMDDEGDGYTIALDGRQS